MKREEIEQIRGTALEVVAHHNSAPEHRRPAGFDPTISLPAQKLTYVLTLALKALDAQEGWKPIESAPKDEDLYLAHADGEFDATVLWFWHSNWGCWVDANDSLHKWSPNRENAPAFFHRVPPSPPKDKDNE